MTETPTIKRGVRDPESVRHLCDLLAKRGYAVDVRSTRETVTSSVVHAIKRFQAQHCDLAGEPLAVDGIVGPRTWSALARPLADEQRIRLGGVCADRIPAVFDLGSPVYMMLAHALRDYDARRAEEPLGSNRCPWLEDRAQGKPWCSFQVHAWIRAARGKFVFGGYRGSTRVDLRKAREADLLVDAADARPGDVWLLCDAKGRPYHTGLVLRRDGDTMDTVEGNCANRVAVRRREIVEGRVKFWRPFPGELDWEPGLLPWAKRAGGESTR